MLKKCVICDKKIEEDYNKLNGTLVRVKNEKGKRRFIYVCSECQHQDNWIEKAKVKGV
jgi:uncharacterized protein YlaI